MLYRYAWYSKKHNNIHYSILFCIFTIFITHVTCLLTDENIWLFLGIFIYIPVLICYWRVSTLRESICHCNFCTWRSHITD